MLTLVPILYVVIRSVGADGYAWERLFSERTLELLVNSLGLAGAVAVAAVAISLPYAWLVTSTDMPARRFFEITGALPLVVPSYVGAAIMIDAFGPRGLLQQALESPLGIERMPSLYGFFGAFVTLTLFTYPYVLLLAIAAFKRVDPAMEESARGLGLTPVRAFVRATLPQLRPALVAGGLLCALYAISDFGVVSLMRFDTLTRSIYNLYRSFYDPGGAALLASLVIILTGTMLALEHRLRVDPQKLAVRSARSAERSPVAIGRWRYAGIGFCLWIFLFSIAVPLLVLGYWVATGPQADWFDDQTINAIAGSVTASSWAALAATALALPVAIVALRHSGRAARVIETITTSGFALPGVVVALGLVFFATRYAGPLYQSLALLVVAYVIRFIPQAIEGARTGLERADPGLDEAARGLGAGRMRVFRRVTLPLAAPGVAAGAMLVFLTAMKELPATLILKPTGFETLATRIWAAANTGSYSQAAVPALILIAISATALAVGSSKRVDSGRPRPRE
ncbi:MAG: iron ABC transporter permease [Thermoleophilaceae bacterium]|nr:iron ABC transporter permease [Thermoleophilaceae bacterium]